MKYEGEKKWIGLLCHFERKIIDAGENRKRYQFYHQVETNFRLNFGWGKRNKHQDWKKGGKKTNNSHG